MKTFIKTAVFSAAVVMLAACNTVAGAGEDIKSGGEVITDTAKDVQNDINE